MTRYVELHCHTNYSFLDGASWAGELVERAADLGYDALGVTDHDGFRGAVQMHAHATRVGLPIIYGTEVGMPRDDSGSAGVPVDDVLVPDNTEIPQAGDSDPTAAGTPHPSARSKRTHTPKPPPESTTTPPAHMRT